MKIIDSGVLCHSDGHNVSYEVGNGWSPDTCADCDEVWGAYTVEFLNFIAHQGFNGDELAKVLRSLQVSDKNWSWLAKAVHYRSEGHEWFYLLAEGKPQGMCVIYHPKESLLSEANIFYVHFLAVAPWNRDCSIRKRQLKGVGTALLRAALRFSVNQLKLSAGFSLHSVPSAVVFYKKLKMINIKEHNDGTLAYFELPAEVATELMGVA